MNTFGLNKKVNSFWLGSGIITEAWKELVSFALNIKRNIQFYIER